MILIIARTGIVIRSYIDNHKYTLLPSNPPPQKRKKDPPSPKNPPKNKKEKTKKPQKTPKKPKRKRNPKHKYINLTNKSTNNLQLLADPNLTQSFCICMQIYTLSNFVIRKSLHICTLFTVFLKIFFNHFCFRGQHFSIFSLSKLLKY